MSRYYYKMTVTKQEDKITEKHLEIIQKKFDKSAQIAFVCGVVKISSKKIVQSFNDTQYYLFTDSSIRDKIAKFLEKEKIAFVSIVPRESLPAIGEV